MIFRYAFVAESAEIDAEGRFSVQGGGVSIIHSPALPAYMPALAVVVGIAFQPPECGKVHPIRVVVQVPENVAGPFQYTVNFHPESQPIDPSVSVTPPAVMKFNNIPIPVKGEYKFRFFNDQEFLGETSLTVLVPRL